MSMQPVGVVFPDVELLVCEYLRNALSTRPEPYADAHVANVKRDNRTRQVVVRRDGGASRGVLDYPRLGIRVFADVEQDASDLARLVAALLIASPGYGEIVRALSLSGPSGVPDDSQFMKYLTLELTTKGVAL